MCGHIADRGGRNRALKHVRAGQRYPSQLGAAVCKTVGSAYVGSNPTPATPAENPLTRVYSVRGLLTLCDCVRQAVAVCGWRCRMRAEVLGMSGVYSTGCGLSSRSM